MAAVAVSLVEIAVGAGVLASLEENDFADEVECLDLLAILITAVVFCSAFDSYVKVTKPLSEYYFRCERYLCIL